MFDLPLWVYINLFFFFLYCRGTDICNDVDCGSPGKTCIFRASRPVCVCLSLSDCPAVCQPVCGSDGKTYPHWCAVYVEACQRNLSLTVVADGTCKDGQYLLCAWKLLQTLLRPLSTLTKKFSQLQWNFCTDQAVFQSSFATYTAVLYTSSNHQAAN